MDEVVEVISKACYPVKPDLSNPNAPLLDCGLDFLDYATSLLALEEKFDIPFPSEKLEQINTVKTIVDFISSQRR